ncbi:MAG: MoaD/ThiS family protein [Kineosporiaceae bacterium]
MSVDAPEVVLEVSPVLRPMVAGQDRVTARGETVDDVLDDLVPRYPALVEALRRDGRLGRFVNLYVGERDLRVEGGLTARLAAGDVVSTVVAVSGG